MYFLVCHLWSIENVILLILLNSKGELTFLWTFLLHYLLFLKRSSLCMEWLIISFKKGFIFTVCVDLIFFNFTFLVKDFQYFRVAELLLAALRNHKDDYLRRIAIMLFNAILCQVWWNFLFSAALACVDLFVF